MGIIHSPLRSERIDFPWRVLEQVQREFQPAVQYQTPYHWAAAYVLVSLLLVGLSYQRRAPDPQRTGAPDQSGLWGDSMAATIPASPGIQEAPHP